MKMQAFALARWAAAVASAARRFGSVSPASMPPPSLRMWRREKPSQLRREGPKGKWSILNFPSNDIRYTLLVPKLCLGTHVWQALLAVREAELRNLVSQAELG